ncbi:hypothetical protein MHY1_02948 [Methylovirgula sp. HY1]|nr:putative entry exclusion protein TrbK-alt [Methylovirgula sp. HY1]QXX76113.1 hypothetical protein MHY1_02948 [Methylovirgula sp. HY1]
MRRGSRLRAALMIGVIGLYLVALAAINREDLPAHGPANNASPSDADIPTELRRCNALGPQDADDPHCRAVWAENRRRFFGLPPKSSLRASAPQPGASPTKPGTSPIKPQSSNAGDARP